MVALKMWPFRAGQKQRLKSIQTETLRHSYQNTSLLLCPVTHSSTDLHAFTCLTSDSFLVSASTPLQISLCYGPRAECPPWKARLTWAELCCPFSHDTIQGMGASPLLQFAAQSQTSAQSRFACSPYWAHGIPHSCSRRVWRHWKEKLLAAPVPCHGAMATHGFAGARWARWGTVSMSPIAHFLATSPADLAVLILCLFCRWWADPSSRRVKEWHQELGF